MVDVPPRGQPAAASVGVGRPPCRPGRLGVVSVPPRSPREIGVSVVTVERWSHCGTPGPPNPLTSYFPIPNFQIQLPIPIPNSQFQSLSIWRRSIRRAHDSRASPLKPAGALRLSDTPHALDGRASMCARCAEARRCPLGRGSRARRSPHRGSSALPLTEARSDVRARPPESEPTRSTIGARVRLR